MGMFVAARSTVPLAVGQPIVASTPATMGDCGYVV
jgi:hypothetical protein